MFKIRPIKKSDNKELAQIIRASLEQKGVNRPGTVYTDSTTDNLFELFQAKNSFYYVIEKNNEILGGCGIYPTKDLPLNYCELVKLYIKPKAKGQGLGKLLMDSCTNWAKEHHYTHLYLETLKELKSAVSLYEEQGFSYLAKSLGDSGHNACDILMLKKID